MAEDNIVQKIKRWKPMSKRPIGRPKTRWEDDVLEDVKSVNVLNLKKVAHNRDIWKKVVEQARTLYGLYRFTRRMCACEKTISVNKYKYIYVCIYMGFKQVVSELLR